ncbi:low molecular weight protein-tyrosine-phosphatase [Rhodoferax antarcticus]|uniref:protein-tyrosine-phosphatase n=1 Tax=Rhodoferax antarcticus ANT.BR TaxID=1111071 RepID=A0A1Q8YH99_9BURK|nr:low molecular weight protein-tyrosine-phosphatase [Rhodoferax antarcticus]APW45115.1 hypothetical protein RA876_00530 [Rhodoferax antarcticus]MCW2313588.1 protein-tyrosine phosphatase [Rhodoferax antarcticus]OLP07337.1 tyrosine phosphatase family protein [Rhodoferax antarcticus ANT.BR]
MNRILMVCMANICRSPMACSVAQHLARQQGRHRQFEFDAAGTHAPTSAKHMDPRARQALLMRDYQPVKTRSRQVCLQDFERFDLILAMDNANLAVLQRQCPGAMHGKLRLLLSAAPDLGFTEIPDPYYGDAAGFERVLALCESGARGLLAQL